MSGCPHPSLCFPCAWLLISHTLSGAVTQCSSHSVSRSLCVLQLFCLQFLSGLPGVMCWAPARPRPPPKLSSSHLLLFLGCTLGPGSPPCLLQPHLAYLSILLDSFPLSLKLQWHRNQKHPFSLGPVFPSISTHHNNISITLAACWGLSFNHVDNGF